LAILAGYAVLGLLLAAAGRAAIAITGLTPADEGKRSVLSNAVA
jgi:hypothetical protein